MSIEDSTLALAGAFQAAILVKQIAHKGLVDQAPFEASIQSILMTDAPSTEAVFGGAEGVLLGLKTFNTQFDSQVQNDLMLMRYVWGMIFLERKLIKNPAMLNTLTQGIDRAKQLSEMYGTTHESVITNLATLYSQTLSTFDYRIQITGEKRFLENEANANKVRALLLAGIRATVLWRQKGGTRLQFLLSRKKILRTVQHYLTHH